MSAAAYYNEIDPFAAQWLRNLIAAGHIAPGEVDERSIEDVTPDDLRGFTQCHFFAGIGVWSHSLRLAGWPDDRPVWTGSCPCQPFSAAGKGDGFTDERHLWPHFFHLISERRPQHVFGEQVAARNANVWFDLVQADLEGMGYAFGLVPFTSASIGAPHIRERAYWGAHAHSQIDDRRRNVRANGWDEHSDGSHFNGMAYPNHRICDEGETLRTGRNAVLDGSIANRLAHTDNEQHSISISRCGHEYVSTGRQQDPAASAGLRGDYRTLEVNGFWRDADWLLCRDGKWRPVEPGTFPLVDGAAARLGRVEPGVARVASSNRVGRLKGYGNAINAQAAAAFIRAYMGVA
ncbi:DNA cytosine methyltransferase [Klebsiella pneumoniae]|uniref:DNA cytosine methyltransferase n=1 Tax=Klebsiella pneumoniae TaxID=573 RepID=UPI002D7BD948|nr:DNA cytosine methyltransferase [Klebsiella pneumoniae]MEA4596655.1 DNA cytosine methyltransferase [Klebsiella pneumoniae]MEC4510874.1 DNA cytosine methyltransferase [Klebsiella pneumoniae]HDO6740701.1 DNA cytosine methyltransferase [Klebsiella pneumoniae]